MQTSRRKFIAGLGALAAAIVAAPVVLEALPASGSTTLPGELQAKAVGPTLQVGDVFTIEGRFAVNPITQRSTGILKQFVVTQAAPVEALTARVDPPMYPRMVDVGPYRNVSSARPFTSSDVRLVAWPPVPESGPWSGRDWYAEPSPALACRVVG